MLCMGPSNHISQPVRQADEQSDAQRSRTTYPSLYEATNDRDRMRLHINSAPKPQPILSTFATTSKIPSVSGNSFSLLNKMKRFNFLPALCGSIHMWFIDHLQPTHLCVRLKLRQLAPNQTCGIRVQTIPDLRMVQLKEFSNLQGLNVIPIH